MVSQILDWRFAFDNIFINIVHMYFAGCQYKGMNCALSVSLWPDCLRARPGHSIQRWDDTPPIRFMIRGSCFAFHEQSTIQYMMTSPLPKYSVWSTYFVRGISNVHMFSPRVTCNSLFIGAVLHAWIVDRWRATWNVLVQWSVICPWVQFSSCIWLKDNCF